MRNLEPLRLMATSVLGSAVFDLRMAAGAHAPTSPTAGLHLGQLAAGANQALVHLPWQVKRGTTGLGSPTLPDPWIIAAGDLHDAVSDANDAVIGLLEAAENHREVVTVPEGAWVLPGDRVLFGFEPCGEAFDGWTAPTDVDALVSMPLDSGSPAWTRRVDIVWSADRWRTKHKAALDASGAQILQECCGDLHQVQVAIREAVLEVRPGTLAASRVIARMAARSLVEIGDDPKDLAKVVRDYIAILGPHEPSALAWHAILGLLVLEPKP